MLATDQLPLCLTARLKKLNNKLIYEFKLLYKNLGGNQNKSFVIVVCQNELLTITKIKMIPRCFLDNDLAALVHGNDTPTCSFPECRR